MKRIIHEFLDERLTAVWTFRQFFDHDNTKLLYYLVIESDFLIQQEEAKVVRELLQEALRDDVTIRMIRLDVYEVYGLQPDDLLILQLRFFGKRLE